MVYRQENFDERSIWFVAQDVVVQDATRICYDGVRGFVIGMSSACLLLKY